MGSHTFENGVCTECGAKESEPEHIPGDTNGDGNFSVTDMLKVKSAILGEALSEVSAAAGDINADGIVNASDAACILQYAAAVGAGYTGTLEEYMAK